MTGQSCQAYHGYMATNQGHHIAMLRDRARRFDPKDRSGRGNDTRAAIEAELYDLDDMEDD